MCALFSTIALGGCTSATIDLPDGTHVAFQRMWTDAAISFDDGGFVYSSNASDVAQQATLDALLKALGLATRGVRPMALHASEAGL
jgi:hypothetical protein